MGQSYNPNDPDSIRVYKNGVRDVAGGLLRVFDHAYDDPSKFYATVVVSERAGTFVLTLRRMFPTQVADSRGVCDKCGLDAWGFADYTERLQHDEPTILRNAAGIMVGRGQANVAATLIEAAGSGTIRPDEPALLRRAAEIMKEYGQTHIAIALLEAADAKANPHAGEDSR